MFTAILVDRCALDIFHRHIRPTIGGHSAIDQAGNSGVLQPGEQAAFALEHRPVIGRLDPQQFERDRLIKTSVTPVRQIDFAHPAAPDQLLDLERPDKAARCKRWGGGYCRPGIKTRCAAIEHAAIRRSLQQSAQLIRNMRWQVQLCKMFGPAYRWQFQQIVKMASDNGPIVFCKGQTVAQNLLPPTHRYPGGGKSYTSC